MLRSRRGLLLVLIGVVTAAACQSGGSGSSVATGSGGMASVDDTAGSCGVVQSLWLSDHTIGSPIYTLTQTGEGGCVCRSLAQMVDAVHADRPELADINQLYGADPNIGGDGSFIYAYARDHGFALVFKRGGGDCPSGCIDNEYWYFETDLTCMPIQVGHFKAGFGTGSCLMTTGTPMWNRPTAPDPAVVCGADEMPTSLSGRYIVYGTGTQVDCTAKGDAEPRVNVSTEIIMTVAQSADSLSKGEITLVTDQPMLRGQTFSGTFTGKRFTTWAQQSNGAPRCPAESSVQLDLDFESSTLGHLEFRETRALACAPLGQSCKGQLILDLAFPR